LSFICHPPSLKLDQEVKDVSGKSNWVTRRVSLLELIILALTVQWLLSFFGQSLFPGVPHTGGFIYMLSALIVLLIIVKFLSQV